MGNSYKASAAPLIYRIYYLSDIHGLQTLTDKHKWNFVAHMKQGWFKIKQWSEVTRLFHDWISLNF